MSQRQSPERSWRFRTAFGTAGELHARDLIAESSEFGLVQPTVWWCRAQDPAIVIGSAQARGACGAPAMPAHDAAGRPVVARRSGGGAVLVGEDEGIWVDIVLGRDDPRWIDDVSHSADWLGTAWAAALAEVGVAGPEVYSGPLEGRWAPHVCFAGRAGGEVLVAGQKLVGISQRRTRTGARFQTHVLRRWTVDPLIDVVVASPDRAQARADVATRAIGLGELGVVVDPLAVVEALLRHVM